MLTRRTLAGFVAAVALATTGCGTDEGDTSNRPAGSGQANGSGGDAASSLAFTATTVDGEAFDAASLRGEPTVFWFWAPWCPTCAAQAPDVTALADDHAGAVNVVGVASLGSESEMTEFVERTDTSSLTHLNDEGGAVWQRFGITEQSTFALVDGTGAVTYSGYLDSDELADRVVELAG